MPCCFVLWLRQVVESVSIYCRSLASLRETFKFVVARHPCYWMHFFCVAKHKLLCGPANSAQKQYEDKTALTPKPFENLTHNFDSRYGECLF